MLTLAQAKAVCDLADAREEYAQARIDSAPANLPSWLKNERNRAAYADVDGFRAISYAAAAVMDHLNGHEGFEDGEALLDALYEAIDAARCAPDFYAAIRFAEKEAA